MELYLVRHAKAEAADDDARRKLTAGGRDAANDVARTLKRTGVRVDLIEHSPLVRARETAEIIGRSLDASLTEVSDLLPSSNPADLRQRLLSQGPQSLMLVGHNPFMEMLAGLLIAEDPEALVLSFHTATVARLLSVPQGQGWRYTCDWLLTPGMAFSSGK